MSDSIPIYHHMTSKGLIRLVPLDRYEALKRTYDAQIVKCQDYFLAAQNAEVEEMRSQLDKAQAAVAEMNGRLIERTRDMLAKQAELIQEARKAKREASDALAAAIRRMEAVPVEEIVSLWFGAPGNHLSSARVVIARLIQAAKGQGEAQPQAANDSRSLGQVAFEAWQKHQGYSGVWEHLAQDDRLAQEATAQAIAAVVEARSKEEIARLKAEMANLTRRLQAAEHINEGYRVMEQKLEESQAAVAELNGRLIERTRDMLAKQAELIQEARKAKREASDALAAAIRRMEAVPVEELTIKWMQPHHVLVIWDDYTDKMQASLLKFCDLYRSAYQQTVNKLKLP